MWNKDCEDFQPCRKFIAEEVAVHLISDIKTVKAGELKAGEFGFKQFDPIMAKEESIGLRIRRTFPNKEIIEDFYVKKLDCIIDFYFPKRRLEIEVDELGHADRDQITETKWKKNRNISWMYIYQN